MPTLSKFNLLQAIKSSKRWKRSPSFENTDYNNNYMNDINNQIDETVEEVFDELNCRQADKETQTNDFYDSTISVCTQTDKLVEPLQSGFISNYDNKLKNEITIENISNLIEVLKDSCSKWSSLQDRILSVILYKLLKYLSFKWEFIAFILEQLNCLNIKYAHSWSKCIIQEGVVSILDDNRGGKNDSDDFYEMYPEIKPLAYEFALKNACKKEASFTVKSLAIYVTEMFQELSGEKLKSGELIRSVASCNVDLLKWGACWDSVKNRPYFEGHERADVVLARTEFLKYFLDNKDLYFQSFETDNKSKKRQWKRPIRIENKGAYHLILKKYL